MAVESIEVLVATEHDGVPRILKELARGARAHPVGVVTTAFEPAVPEAGSGPDVLVAEILTVEGIERLPGMVRLAPVVVVSSLPADVALLPCMAAGAKGFVSREDIGGTLDEAVASVAAGHTYMDATSADWLVAEAVRMADARPPARREKAVRLSEQQLAVLELVDDGLTNAEIAEALGLSANSVKTHLHRAMQKLGVHDRSEAAQVARRGRR